MHHARNVHVHGPLERAVHLGGNVVALRRVADNLELLNRLDLRHAGGRVDVVPRERDVEALAANQLAVGDAPGRLRLHADHGVAHLEPIDRHAEVRGRHLEQHAPRLRGDAAHRPAVHLNRVGAARAALVHGVVGAAHDAARPVERDVELVGHHLAECGAGALAAVRLADVERGGVVFVNDNPRIELAKIGIGIRTRALRACVRRKRAGKPAGAEADDEQARTLEERTARHPRLRLEQILDVLRDVREGGHAILPSAARLIAFCTR